MNKMQKDIERNLEYVLKRGVKLDKKELDASGFRPGLRILGKLDFLNRNGYAIILPTVEMRPDYGYRGLARP